MLGREEEGKARLRGGGCHCCLGQFLETLEGLAAPSSLSRNLISPHMGLPFTSHGQRLPPPHEWPWSPRRSVKPIHLPELSWAVCFVKGRGFQLQKSSSEVNARRGTNPPHPPPAPPPPASIHAPGSRYQPLIWLPASQF